MFLFPHNIFDCRRLLRPGTVSSPLDKDHSGPTEGINIKIKPWFEISSTLSDLCNIALAFISTVVR